MLNLNRQSKCELITHFSVGNFPFSLGVFSIFYNEVNTRTRFCHHQGAGRTLSVFPLTTESTPSAGCVQDGAELREGRSTVSVK